MDEPKVEEDANKVLFVLAHCLLQQGSLTAYISGRHLRMNKLTRLKDTFVGNYHWVTVIQRYKEGYIKKL